MPGAAAAALPNESTEMSQSLMGKGGNPLGRLTDRRAAVQAAISKSPAKASPAKKVARTGDVDVMSTDDGVFGPSAGQFAPAPAFPGGPSSVAPPSTPPGVAPPGPPPSAAPLGGAPAPASGGPSGACPGAGFVPLAHAAASGAPTAPGVGPPPSVAVPGEALAPGACPGAGAVPPVHAAAHPVHPSESASIDEKLNFIMYNMSLKSETASKSDIDEIRKEMKIEVASAVDPLKDEMAEFRQRLAAVESRPASGLDKRQFQMLNSMNPVHKRIAFIGFTGADLAERVSDIERFLSTSASPPSFVVGHFFSGPRSNRVVSKVSYAEFTSSDAAQRVLDELDGKQFFSSNRQQVRMKKAKTQLNLQRDWCLRKASDLIKERLGNSPSVSVKSDFKTREVLVNNVAAFKQESTDIAGNFCGDFAMLRLP